MFVLLCIVIWCVFYSRFMKGTRHPLGSGSLCLVEEITRLGMERARLPLLALVMVLEARCALRVQVY